MAIQVLGRTPHRPEDAGLRDILATAPAPITSAFTATLDGADGTNLGSYGLRMAVLAMREGSLDRVREGLVAMALGAAVHTADDRDLMVDLALPHVAAAQLGARPAEVFATAATRFGEGWLPKLLQVFGGRDDVTLAAFGWRQIATSDGLDIIAV